MKISIFMKTFLMLLVSFSLVFLLSMTISYRRFGPMYVEENINAVRETILDTAPSIKNGTLLEDTALRELSSETSFIRYQNFVITEEIGPDFLDDDNLLQFVIDVFDSEDIIQDGNLRYYIEQVDDIYYVNYIYEFEYGDYVIIATKIQSLQNVDLVLNNINTTQSIAVFITILVLSLIISRSIAKPIKKINNYAKDISDLKFSSELTMKRRDEFRDLISSLNEMTFNLRKTYADLHDANQQLNSDIAFEKLQEQKKKELIYTINHELKTPLSVMKGMIEGMLDGIGRYKDKDKYLQELLLQITKVENIAKDLTYTLRLEDKVTPGETVHTTVLLEQLRELEEFATQRNVSIKFDLKEAEVIISKELLIIIVTNILKNAILYGTESFVTLSTEITSTDYIIQVRNKGHIKDEDVTKLFNSFVRSEFIDESKEGSGLGLFIVKQICDIYDYEYKIFNDNGFVVTKIKLKMKK